MDVTFDVLGSLFLNFYGCISFSGLFSQHRSDKLLKEVEVFL